MGRRRGERNVEKKRKGEEKKQKRRCITCELTYPCSIYMYISSTAGPNAADIAPKSYSDINIINSIYHNIFEGKEREKSRS